MTRIATDLSAAMRYGWRGDSTPARRRLQHDRPHPRPTRADATPGPAGGDTRTGSAGSSASRQV